MTSADTSRQQTVSIDDVITTVVMARVTDFFGFFVYAIASALIFPRVFFPHLDPLTGTLWSFAIFSLAFLARPLGSILSRILQPKIGKPGKVMLALMVLGTSTVAIGLLPGYDKIGITAPILLAVLRFVQGVGLGGSWDGITLQLKAAAPKNRTGLYGVIPQLGGPIGFCVAAAMFYVLTGFLTEDELYTYGWRFAFFAVMAVNVVSLFARLRLMTTDFGAEDPTLLKSAPMKDLFRTEGKTIVLSAALPIAGYALMHMMTVFPISYTLLFTDQAMSNIILWQLLGGSLAIVAVIVSGIMADKYSMRRMLWISCALVPVLGLSIGTLEYAPQVFIVFGFIVLGLSYGQSSAILPNRFAPEFRYSGSAVATNFSWILGAAFAPFIALLLASTFGLWAASLYMLSGAVVTVVALYLLEKRLKPD